MKIKLTFTNEHIALIKAMNFQCIDVDDIIKSFEQYNRKAYIIDNMDMFAESVASYIKSEAKSLARKERDGIEIDNGEIVKDAKKFVASNVVECTLGDVLDNYRINIDSLYGLDNYNLWGGTYIWEQMAYILGIQDHVIKGTEEDPTGPKYPEEDMEHMRDLDAFIITHLKDIFDLLLQFSTEGIQAGVTYWSIDHTGIWHKEESK